MTKYILTLFILFSSHIIAQKQDEAITFANKLIVNSEPKFDSDTIYIIKKNEVFLIAENHETNSDWLYVEIIQDKFSKTNSKNIYGFIPKSKIIFIDNLNKYSQDNVVLKFNLIKADRINKIAHKESQYGLEIPLNISFSVNSMSLQWKGKTINLNTELYDDLYNVSFSEGNYSSIENSKFVIYEYESVFYIKQECADGAGSYEITWAIKNGEIVQRIIDEI
ncbi:hypothetical protein [Flavobacterium sp.]|uniref:hypothetical protein n=1 Tax=Flavobacterium sp. TaxID=239 RepID=UPI003D2C59EE